MYKTVVLLFVGAAISQADNSATHLRWIQQLGGSGSTTVAGIGTDALGNGYVAGTTTAVDLPVKSAFQGAPGSAALVRIDSSSGKWNNLYQPGVNSVSAVKATPSQGALFAIASSGLIETTDGGAHWAQIGTPPDATLTDVAIDNSRSVYLATSNQGLLKSSDGGASFQAQSGLAARTVYRVWTDPAVPSVAFAAISAPATGLLARSSDGGATWQNVYSGSVASLAFDPFVPSTLYIATFAGIARSTDDGLSWSLISTPVDPYGYDIPLALVADPTRSGVLYAAFVLSVEVSFDHGVTWRPVAAQLPGSVRALAADPVTGNIFLDVALNPTSAFVVFAPLSGRAPGDQLLVTGDQFATLTPTGPPTIAPVTSMAVSGSSLFVGTAQSPDVYVAKFDSAGNLVNLTYFGGSGIDSATSMAVDSTGAVYIDGVTTSRDLPVTPGAYANSGQTFLFKVNPDGSLGYATYFAHGLTTPGKLTVDSAGHAFMTGQTLGDLPVTPGAYRSSSDASVTCVYPIGCVSVNPDYFVTQFDGSGSSLVYSTYFDGGQALALAADGSALVAGTSAIYRLSADGSALQAKSPRLDGTYALAMGTGGSLYAAGTADSTFTPTPGAFQTVAMTANTQQSGFLAKLDANLNIAAATLFGGESQTTVSSLAQGTDGSVLIGGGTASFGLPQRNALWAPFSGNTGFVARFSGDLTSLNFSTFAGDADGFQVASVAFGSGGTQLFAGSTFTAVSQAFVDAVAPDQPVPRLDRIVNPAAHLAVPLSPGETVEIDGSGFTASSVVLLNGNQVGSTFVDSTRLIGTVPSDFSAQYATTQVMDGSASSHSILSPASPTSPEIFTEDGSGFGQGYVLNADGSLNSPSNPAAPGSAITLLANGVGSISLSGPYAVTASPVTITIGAHYANGIAAQLGPVAGLPGNVYRISVYVPSGVSGQVTLQMIVNGVASQNGVRMSVAGP